MASSVGGFITLRALHRPAERRRPSARSGRASLPHPSSTRNHLPRMRPRCQHTNQRRALGARRPHEQHASSDNHANHERRMHFHATMHAALPPEPDAVKRPLTGLSLRLHSKCADNAQGQRKGRIGLHGDARGNRASATLRASARVLTCRPSPPGSRAWRPSP